MGTKELRQERLLAYSRGFDSAVADVRHGRKLRTAPPSKLEHGAAWFEGYSVAMRNLNQVNVSHLRGKHRRVGKRGVK